MCAEEPCKKLEVEFGGAASASGAEVVGGLATGQAKSSESPALCEPSSCSRESSGNVVLAF